MADPERAWESGWEQHERAQRRRIAALPLTEKLAWLEESHAVVIHIERSRSSRGTPPGAPDSARP